MKGGRRRGDGATEGGGEISPARGGEGRRSEAETSRGDARRKGDGRGYGGCVAQGETTWWGAPRQNVRGVLTKVPDMDPHGRYVRVGLIAFANYWGCCTFTHLCYIMLYI